MSAARSPDLPADRRIEEAWSLCFSETREWYEGKHRAVERKKRFYHGVQAATDFVEIRQEGHWKVDLLHHTVNEKGLDTSLAVDMVALQETYDIALLSPAMPTASPGSTTSRAGRSTSAWPSFAAVRRPTSPPRARRRGSRSRPISWFRFTSPS